MRPVFTVLGDALSADGNLQDSHLRGLLERTTAALQAHEATQAKRQEAYARLCAIEDKLKPLVGPLPKASRPVTLAVARRSFYLPLKSTKQSASSVTP